MGEKNILISKLLLRTILSVFQIFLALNQVILILWSPTWWSPMTVRRKGLKPGMSKPFW